MLLQLERLVSNKFASEQCFCLIKVMKSIKLEH